MFETSEQPAVVQEQAAELKSGISRTQASIAKAHERQHELQSQNNHLKQRVISSTAAIDAILNAKDLVPDTPGVPDPHQGARCHVFNILVMLFMLRMILAGGVRIPCLHVKSQVRRCTSTMLHAASSRGFQPH